ncbi:MAG: hypothetical protein K8S56_03435 [Candidatus Cloacimonetes bacterium]|nr:hypothetical protein [Candidatus Cloacimonadota bacterium]
MRFLPYLLLIVLLLVVLNCTDSLTRNENINGETRIEFSLCVGCSECIDNFHCPQDAIKFDDERFIAYIDVEKCNSCMRCLDAFTCPEGAFSTWDDVIAPGELTDVSVAINSGNTVTIAFTTTGDDSTWGRAHHYDVALANGNLVSGRTNWLLPVPFAAGTTQQFNLDGFVDDTDYTLLFSAVDEVGNSSPIETLQFYVSGNIPPAQVTDLGLNYFGNMFQLYWTAVGDDGNDGTASAYIIKVHTESLTEQNWDSVAEYLHILIPLPSGSSEFLIVSGLESGTTYYAAMKVMDSDAAESPISNVVTTHP